MKTATRPRGFRAWPKNQERLDFAERIGMKPSELINEVLDQHLKTHIEKKARKIREALSVPIP